MINPNLAGAAILLVSPLPYSVEHSPPFRRSLVTSLLVLANLVIFIATHITSHGMVEPLAAYNRYGVIPAALTPLSLVTYGFMHVSAGHVLWNMLFLYLFGPIVEEKIGSFLFTIMYLAGGAAAGLLHAGIVMHFAANSSEPFVPLVGASGPISAILGLFSVFAGRKMLNLFWPVGTLVGRGWHMLEIPAGVGVMIWLAQTVYGAATTLVSADPGSIAYFAHIGGFVFGAGCGLIGGLHNQPRLNEREAVFTDLSAENQPVARILASNADLLTLLRRSLEEGNYDRAYSLFAKCKSTNAAVSPDDFVRLAQLAEASGQLEASAQFRKLASKVEDSRS